MLEFYLAGVVVAFFYGFTMVWQKSDEEDEFIILSGIAILACTLSWVTIAFAIFARLFKHYKLS